MTFAYIYLPWVNACLAYCHKCESTSTRAQPGEGPSRGLLRDCTTSPINRLHHYFLLNLVEAVAAVILLILVKLSGTLIPRLEARPKFNNLRMFAFL